MTIKKILNENPENNFGLIDFINLVYPDIKSKYYNMIINLIKNDTLNQQELIDEEKSVIKQIFPTADVEEINKLSKFQLYMAFRLSTGLFDNRDEWETINKFIEYNELGLIENTDVTSYKQIIDLKREVAIAHIKKNEKDLRSQILKIYDKDGWLVFRPLSHLSAVKYGYGTKWCTSMESDSEYFKRYSTNGILIYCINKNTNKKIACYCELPKTSPKKYTSISNEENFFVSFWDEKDVNIDSLFTGLPYDVLLAIKNEIETNSFSNIQFFNQEERFKLKKNSDPIKLKATFISHEVENKSFDILELSSNSGIAGTSSMEYEVGMEDEVEMPDECECDDNGSCGDCLITEDIRPF